MHFVLFPRPAIAGCMEAVSPPLPAFPAAWAQCAAHAGALPENILPKCLEWLPLPALPSVVVVACNWRTAAELTFSALLRWRRPAHCAEVSLPLLVSPESGVQVVARIAGRGGGHITFLDDGRVVVLLADPATQSVRTIVASRAGKFGTEFEVSEMPRREWNYRSVSGSMTGGLVGYAESAMAFFPAAPPGGQSPSATTRVIGDGYQNILHAGGQLFLLRSASWWGSGPVPADIVDLHAGGWVRVDVAPLRDALRRLMPSGGRGLSGGFLDAPTRQAVSATRDHFVFHINTASGAKVAGALRLPSAASGAQCSRDAELAPATVSYAKRWTGSHAAALLSDPHELPTGDALLLYGEWEESRGLLACMIESADGETHQVRLRTPPAASPARRAFRNRGIASLCVVAEAGLVLGCGSAPRGMALPAVVLWDLSSGFVLSECGHSDAAPQPSLVPEEAGPQGTSASSGVSAGGLRFGQGEHVECFTENGWRSGIVMELWYREDDWTPGREAPYRIRLDARADMAAADVLAPADIPQLIRRADPRAELYEAGAEVQVALDPRRSQILIGIFHGKRPGGRVFCLSAESSIGLPQVRS